MFKVISNARKNSSIIHRFWWKISVCHQSKSSRDGFII